MPRKKQAHPGVAEIRDVRALTADRDPDPPSCCNVCHLSSMELRLWREGDEFDRPIEGTGALVFIGHDHPNCIGIMERHPRLYTEVTGNAGYFPALCGPCRLRDGFACRHPKLKGNGGPGLLVQLRPLVPMNAIICPPPKGPKVRAEECEGRDLRKPPPAEPAP